MAFSRGVFDISALTAGTYSLPSSASLAGMGTLSGNGKSLAVLGSLAPGNFSAVNATGLAAGQSATFNPATGTITVVPEPSTYAIAAITTASLASLMRWRKQRTRESEA